MKTGFVIFVDSMTEGSVPLTYDEHGKPYIFPTRREAEEDIVDTLMVRLDEFNAGEREFEEAVSVEEYVVKVALLPDGSIKPLDTEE